MRKKTKKTQVWNSILELNTKNRLRLGASRKRGAEFIVWKVLDAHSETQWRHALGRHRRNPGFRPAGKTIAGLPPEISTTHRAARTLSRRPDHADFPPGWCDSSPCHRHRCTTR